MLKRMFHPEVNEVTGGWIKLWWSFILKSWSSIWS